MNFIKKILIGLGLISLGLTGFCQTNGNIKAKQFEFINTRHYKEAVRIEFSPTNLNDGDSLIINMVNPAILTDIYVECWGGSTGYTIDNTDTVKVYGQYNDAAVTMAYFSDSTFTNSHIGGTTIQTGRVDGLKYSVGIPAAKLSGGDYKLSMILEFVRIRR